MRLRIAAALIVAATGCTLLAPDREDIVGGEEVTALACDPPWFAVADHCYAQFTDAVGWDDARDRCKAEGATLAVVTDDAELSQVSGQLGSFESTWIGGYDTLAGDGGGETFAWVDSTEGWWAKWATGEPTPGAEGALGDSVLLVDGLFRDNGRGGLHAYLCEREP